MIDTILSLIKTGQGLPLIVLLLTLVNTLLSDTSKFPITLPDWVRALVLIIVGQGLGVLTSVVMGQPWLSLAVHGLLAAVIAIATSHAVWNGNAPSWMRALAGVAQVLEAPSPTPDAKKPAAETSEVDKKEGSS
jgi:hypothetical protein